MFRILLFLILLNSSVAAQEEQKSSCAHHFIVTYPSSHGQEICHVGYALKYDNQAKIPVYVSWNLDSTKINGCYTRSNSFRVDTLAINSSTPRDYIGSGYDKGHIAPDGDMSYNIITESESFLMTNMTPQLPSLNRGPWKVLEDKERLLASTRNLQIIAGPIYKTSSQIIGRGVVVPTEFFKIIIDIDTKESWSFIYQQESKNMNPNFYINDIKTIEDKTDIKFNLNTIEQNNLFTPKKKIVKKECFIGENNE